MPCEYAKLKELAERNDRLLGDEKDMKWLKKHALLKAKAVAKIGPDSPGTTENVERIADVLVERARPLALQYMAELGLDAQQAMQRALDEVGLNAAKNEGFAEGETKGYLAPGIQNDFPNFKLENLKEYQAQDAKHAADKAKLETDMKKYGTDYSVPGSFISDERLAAYTPDPVNGNYDPLIQTMADRDPDYTVFTLTNKLRTERLGLPPLPMPPSMARFRESTQIPDEAFNRFLKDVDKARTSYDITKAGYNANTGLQSWRAPDIAREQIVKVAQESGLPEGAVLAYAHMSNKNFSLDYAKLSANIQQLSATAEQGGLTGKAREDYIFASLLGDPPKIVDGQLKLTDAQQVNLDNLVKNRASFADPAVMNSGANLNPTYRKVSQVNTVSTAGMEPWAQSIAQLVGGAEVGNLGPEAMYPGRTLPGAQQMSIAEVARRATGAVGQFQNMPRFLVGRARKAGLDPNTAPYSVENQGKIFMVTLKEKGITKELINGSDRDRIKAQLLLSQIYAGIPVPENTQGHVQPVKAGQSYYEGVGNNKATITNQEAQRVLRSIAQQGMI